MFLRGCLLENAEGSDYLRQPIALFRFFGEEIRYRLSMFSIRSDTHLCELV